MSVTYAEVSKVRKTGKEPFLYDYGNKLPTRWEVQIKGSNRWRKLWAMCNSNVASFYIIVKGELVFVRDDDLIQGV